MDAKTSNGRSTTMSTESLTLNDLRRALNDERHNGFGYATAATMRAPARERLDLAVVAVANELGLDYEDLLEWVDSKTARWLIDEAAGRGGSQSRDAVREYLNPAALVAITVSDD